MHAALGAVAIVEITLLHRQAAQVVPRHGADLAQLADEEIGKRLVGLLRLLRLRLMGLHLEVNLWLRVRL